MYIDDIPDQELKQKLMEWLEWDKNELTRVEIENLLKLNKCDTLRILLCSRMEFGTAGLRSAMGAGYSRMNDLTIIQTTQGFCKYILQATPAVREKGVIIGYDARHNSKRFAQLASIILINQSIPVYLFSDICPTPFVAYGVLKMKCSWGIMVTASHNPKEDNGYKVYFENGAQIISPHDAGISKEIKANLEPWQGSWNTQNLSDSKLLNDPYDEVFSSYMDELTKLSYHRESNKSSSLTFTYTAMHGVGYKFVCEAMKVFNFKPCIAVVEQVYPDPDFPTVKYPNPEEGKSALDLAIKTANSNESTLILANDPDADRLAVAEKQIGGEWYTFNGNEIGGLLAWWLIHCYRQQNGTVEGTYCLSSTVSSKIVRSISSAEGVGFEETLTGFKFMGNKSWELMGGGKTVIFAFEEAIGFMCGTTVLDKDGVSACVVLAEMANYLNEEGKTLMQQLNWIYERFGQHISNNSYYICRDPVKIKKIFNRIRNLSGPEQYPIKCGKYVIEKTRDLSAGYDNSQSNNKPVLPVNSSSEMMTFTFHDPPCVVTLRTSGTEPKIKYYSEYCSDPSKKMDSNRIREELDGLVETVITEFLQPNVNQLISRQN